MTTPDFADAPPLLTDADVLARVRGIVGRAHVDRQLWIMLVDGDGRQTPVVIPVADLPRRPPGGLLAGLAEVLAGLREELTTDLGPGSVILTLERLGPGRPSSEDRAWATALESTCEAAGIGLRGVFLSSDAGVRRLR